jgi:OHCU decarboxylase
MMNRYPRNMNGQSRQQTVIWPNNAKIAVQFVVNYEEGGENCLLHGDTHSEAFLSEIVGAQPWPGQRHWNMESLYDYGARAGFWRLYDLFTKAAIPVTVYGVATALARSPDQMLAMQDANWEIASHGYKWIDYKDFSRADEAKHIAMAIELHQQVTGARPQGWYTGRCSEHTVDLVCEAGGFSYISDSYADDLPYWHMHQDRPHLIIPYTLDANDMRFAAPQGFNAGDQFYNYLRDSFDALYREGDNGQPKMLSIGLHCRLIGRPGRIESLRRFIDYIQSYDDVWCPRRIDIATYWHQTYPCDIEAWHSRPSSMDKASFLDRFSDVFELSPWVAEGAFMSELGPAHDTATGLHNAFCRVFRAANEQQKLAVLLAHPDLAGKLAAAKRLTQHSTDEQASAGLDALTADEHAVFTDLNDRYREKFGFPFIIAVKGLTKSDIIAAFKTRLDHDRDSEFTAACHQVEKIALLRLQDMV